MNVSKKVWYLASLFNAKASLPQLIMRLKKEEGDIFIITYDDPEKRRYCYFFTSLYSDFIKSNFKTINGLKCIANIVEVPAPKEYFHEKQKKFQVGQKVINKNNPKFGGYVVHFNSLSATLLVFTVVNNKDKAIYMNEDEIALPSSTSLKA